MAISVPKNLDSIVYALVNVYNSLQSATILDGYHRDISQLTSGSFQDPSLITLTTLQVVGTAVDQPTTMALCDQIQGVLGVHMLDAQAHSIADVNKSILDGYVQNGPYVAASAAAQLVVLQNNLNAFKSVFNAHRTAVGVHANNDTGNISTASAAVDLATSETLSLDLKAKINSHISNAGLSSVNSPRINIVSR